MTGRGGRGHDLERAREELTRLVMGRQGVAGTAVGERSGEACLIVYVTEDSAARKIPDRVRGVPVTVEKSGPFRPR